MMVMAKSVCGQVTRNTFSTNTGLSSTQSAFYSIHCKILLYLLFVIADSDVQTEFITLSSGEGIAYLHT